jgi:hypothetical protein
VGDGWGVGVGAGGVAEGRAGEDERAGAGAGPGGRAVGADLVRAGLVGAGAGDEAGTVVSGLGGAIAAASGRPPRCWGAVFAARVSDSPAIANAASTRTPPAMACC